METNQQIFDRFINSDEYQYDINIEGAKLQDEYIEVFVTNPVENEVSRYEGLTVIYTVVPF